MQEAAAGGVGVLAQVEAEPAFRRLGLESQGPLGAGQVPLQRDGRGGVRHLAEALADDQPVLDEGERDVGPLAHDGPYGVGRLAQTGQRAAPEGGEGLREPDRLDDMGGGDGPVLGAEQPGDLGHPALDRPVGDVEEVPVPAGGVDPGAVTAVPGEAAVGPRHPGQLRLDLREPLEQGAVGGEGGPRGEGGRVPGPADHGDGVPELLAHRAQLNPHVRLAHRVPGPVAVAVRLAERAHGLRQRGERGERGPGSYSSPAPVPPSPPAAPVAPDPSPVPVPLSVPVVPPVPVPPPGERCSTTSSHQRSGSSYPAVSASTRIGSTAGVTSSSARSPDGSPSSARGASPAPGAGPRSRASARRAGR
ncbi:hypothetical protein SCALM49S_08326 [Streptomyces californicus]